MPRLLTVDEVADLLRISRRGVYRKIQRGDLPAIRLGAGQAPYRVEAGELEHYIHAARMRPNAHH